VAREEVDAIEIEKIRKIKADAAGIAVNFLGETAAFVLAEEVVLLVPAEGGEHRLKLHDGGILSSASDGRRLMTGGDDGHIVASDRVGSVECLYADDKGRWIDHLAVSRTGSTAWSVGKTAFYCAADGSERTIQVPSSIGGLAFAPDESVLAIAHYNGVTLWEPDMDRKPTELSWKGSHLEVSFSPDGQVLVTSLREPTLHAWQMQTKKDLPTPSYPTRVRSMDWTASGRFLATSGSDRLTLLSFQLEDNPLARMPLLLAPYRSIVATVACHPTKEIVAVGYGDGLVLLVRIPDGAEIMIKPPDDGPISAMGWNAIGTQIGIASEDGQCRVVSLK
jgi:WD40 repeat protein